MPGEVEFKWIDFEGHPIETERMAAERPRSSTEASDEFLRKVSRTFNVVGVTASAETLWIIRDFSSTQDPIPLIAGTVSGITAVASFWYARKLKKR